MRAPGGQAYGERKKQEDAQRVAPLPATPALEVRPVAGTRSLPQVTSLSAPSERPGEPVTSGLPVGPGVGAEALGVALDAVDKLKLLYARFPDPDVLELIIAAEGE